ncbi:hypothetical protein GCM10010869_51440 [Mesorhizobium tianshanense]|uniref:Uncharacterized protein n=1 Tax=Mesorhizobium tianshanense TaxID=39844 RepID=A0A562PFL1_9HYPH|nr:hypothetical protein [Mesorhizobium tianshanense]TWI43199.1 hypothetical protein IQ26_00161 [Mesorhizobium tianshanense]GLS39547.1 hypothetical protein GCM10010869_51440 [Mesorhizobium tianshanense]
MLPATQDEIDTVTRYFEWQAPDLTVEFLQKVYVENVLDYQHCVWDIHTNKDRWWVITNPTNLYAQEQFPNMDLALTFHVGLCLRIPRSEKKKLSDLPVEPMAECYRIMSGASDALAQAQEVADYQAIGVRCREALLAFVSAAQTVMPWRFEQEKPQRANLQAWADHICLVSMPGETHKERRHLFKTLLESEWQFANWLTHSKTSKWHDAETAVSTTENAISLATSAVIRHMRGVPEVCPSCGSHRLSPERGYRSEDPEDEWERPTCDVCDWKGRPVQIVKVPQPPEEDNTPPEGDCVIPTVPLRKLMKP